MIWCEAVRHSAAGASEAPCAAPCASDAVCLVSSPATGASHYPSARARRALGRKNRHGISLHPPLQRDPDNPMTMPIMQPPLLPGRLGRDSVLIPIALVLTPLTTCLR